MAKNERKIDRVIITKKLNGNFFVHLCQKDCEIQLGFIKVLFNVPHSMLLSKLLRFTKNLCFFASFFLFSFFPFSVFHAKNMKETDLTQGLECVAPKHWSKYTTSDITIVSKTSNPLRPNV